MTITAESTAVTEFKPSEKINQFLKTPRKMLIAGEWVNAVSGKTFDVMNPATGEVIGKVAEGNQQDIDLAVKAARKAFESGPWATITPSERGKLMWRLADLLESHLDEFAELESLDNGKPIQMCKFVDVPLAIDMFRYMAGWATKIEGTTIPVSVPFAPGAKFFSYTLREPVGVVGQIIPWNFPLLMAAWKLGPALATGCTVVLKPAEQTPLTALRLGELILEAGYPAGVVNIIPGFGETAGGALAAHPDVDKVAFTGSTEVGRLIVKAAGETNLKKLTLELGGKSPNIVFNDSDMKQAISGAANAIFFNQGQVCSAGSRLYIEKSVFDEVVEGVATHAKKIRVGHGLDPKTQMGPLVSAEQLSRVCNYLDIGVGEGATALAGGKRFGTQGYFVEPTVLVNTHPAMKVVQEEIFGPVVTAMPFEKPEDIVSVANDSIYGLAAAIWTQDITKAHRTAAQLRAGSVWINCYNVFDAALPFGGYKQSGWGREMGKDAIDLYTEVKAVTIQM
ncbi:MAG: aldehyde dehydrogenase family protein [Cyanobacteria bacterium]|nr:aldehyde dehydrogenase family protein [Cyanobacteriota bacterium]